MYFHASCFPRTFFMVILVLLEQMQWRAGLLAVLLWTLLSTKSCQSYCTQYGELTPLDPYLTENSNYTLNCTLDQTVIDGIRYNSSQLHLHSFVPGLNPLPQHTREEPDERTVLFHIEAVPNKGRNYENQYYCYAGDNGFLRGKCIGATILHVGPKPQPPTSVSCIVYAQKYMTCSYKIPQQEDTVTLLWGVQSRVNRGQVTTPFYCTNFTKTSCTWSGHGRDSFHANTVYWIALYTNNSFGHAFAEGDPDIPGSYFKVNASLIVKPDPIELRKISSGKRNLTLEWQESSDGQRRNQMAYNYTVHYNCTTPWGGEEVLKREVHKLTRVKLENLWPDIEYRVGVTAIPAIGGYDSDMKNTLTVRTLPDAPASPPINRPELFYRDESCGLNCQNIKLFWQPVLPMDRNGEITHYLVTPNGTSNSMYVDNRAYTYTVEKILSPKEKHTMQLQAITKGGSSPIAYYYIPSVSEDPPMVKQLAVTKVDNNTKVLMTWRVPDDFTVTLFWCKSTAEICNESPSWQTISGKNSSFQVPFNGTEAFEEFQYAAAVTVNGISGGLTWSQCLYQEGAVPARGPVLKSTSLQPHNQVTVEWAQMSCEETGSAQVVAYVVEYAYVTEELNCSNIKSSVWERVSLDDPETFIWSMEDLEAGKTMCVRVAAKSIVGLGPFSIPKMVRISGLLKGEIAGITIGVVVCTVLIILGIILCFKSGRNCYKYMFKKIEINIPESLEEYTVNYHGASNGGFVSVYALGKDGSYDVRMDSAQNTPTEKTRFIYENLTEDHLVINGTVVRTLSTQDSHDSGNESITSEFYRSNGDQGCEEEPQSPKPYVQGIPTRSLTPLPEESETSDSTPSAPEYSQFGMNHGKQIVLETVPGTNYVQAGYPICDESSIAKPDNMTVMCVQRQGTPANKPPPLLQDSLSQPETLDTSISSYVKTAQKQSPDDSHSMSKKDLMDHSYNEIGSYVKTAANGICLSPPTDPADSSVGSYVQVAASQNINNNNLNGGVSPPPVENSSNPVGDEYLEPLPSSEAGKMDTVQVPQNQDKSTSKSSLIAVNKAYGIEVPEKNSLENADTSPLSVGDKFSAGGKYVEVSNAPDEEYDEGDGSSMTEKLEQGVTVKLSKPIPEGVDSGKNFGTYAVLDNTDEDDEVFSSYVQGPGSSENYVHTDNEDSFISPDVQKLDSSEDPRVSIENSEYVTEIPKFIAAQEHDTGYVANPNIIPLDNDKQGPIGTMPPAVSASAPVVKASPKRKSDQVVSGNNVLAPVASQIKAGVPLQYPTNGGYVTVPPPVPPSSNTAATYNGYVTAEPPVVPSVVSTANTGYVTDPAPAPSPNTIAADRREGAPSKVPTVSNITNNGYVTSPPPVTHQAATNSGTAPRTSVASDNTPAGNGYMTAPPVIVSTCVNTNTGYVTAPPILVQSASKATCNGQLRKPLPDTSTVNGYVTAPPPVNNTVNSTRERALPQITSPALNSNGYVTTAPTVLPPATCNNGYVTAPEVQLASAATNHRNVTPIPTTEVSPVFSTTTNGYVTVPPTMSSVPSTTSAANTGYVTAPPVVPSVSTTADAAVKNMVPPSKLKSQKVPNANTGHVSDPVMVSLKEENNNDAIGRYTHVGGAENSQHRDKGACDGTLKDNYKSTGSDLTHNKNWSNKSSPSHFKMAPVNDQGYVTMPNTTDTATLSHQQDTNKRGDLMKRDSGYGSPLSSPKDVINQEDNQT